MRTGPVVAMLVLMLPAVMAQSTISNPVEGAYEDIYVVTGRIVDETGFPAANANIVIRIDQQGVKAEPLIAKTECYGTFIAYFKIHEVRRDGKLRIGVFDPDGNSTGATVVNMDPFYRRSDVNVKLDKAWPGGCPEAIDVWEKRVTATGRILTRTDRYDKDGAVLDARPYNESIRIRFWDTATHYYCPPSLEDPTGCNPLSGQTDERGDFRYSWTIDRVVNLTAASKLEVILHANTTSEKSYNFTVDPTFRLAVAHVEASGKGAPKPTPAPGVAALLGAAALVALAAAGRRRR